MLVKFGTGPDYANISKLFKLSVPNENNTAIDIAHCKLASDGETTAPN